MSDKKYTGKDSKRNKTQRGNRRRGSQRDTRKDVPETSAIGDNNPNWYIPDPMVMDQATRFSFSNFIGEGVNLDPTNKVTALSDSVLEPGALMQVFLNPSPGYTTWFDAKNAAINQQAFRTYARLSSSNAKNTLYTPNDVATCILAIGELISMIAVAQRAYGLLWTYNVRNRLMPKSLLQFSGIKADDLAPNAADYLTTLNTLIVEANKIPFPGNIEYFKQCAELYSGVYADSDSAMAELYVPLPYSTWDLEEDLVLEGTVLKTNVLWSTHTAAGMDPFEFLDLISVKIRKLLTSNTYNLVYSDIINLATKDPSVQILNFVPVDPNYAVAPVYDKEFLLKINNATILGAPLAAVDQDDPTHHTPSNDVVPDKDILSMKYAPQWTREFPDLTLLKLINFYNDSPTLEERVIATRYMAGSGMYVNPMKGSGKAPIATNYYTNDTMGMGDHYVVGVTVWTNLASDPYVAETSAVDVTENTTPSILTRFSQHPYIYEYTFDAEFSKWEIAGLVGDLDFWSTLDFDTLARINKLALFALFDMKDVNKVA